MHTRHLGRSVHEKIKLPQKVNIAIVTTKVLTAYSGFLMTSAYSVRYRPAVMCTSVTLNDNKLNADTDFRDSFPISGCWQHVPFRCCHVLVSATGELADRCRPLPTSRPQKSQVGITVSCYYTQFSDVCTFYLHIILSTRPLYLLPLLTNIT